MYPIIALLLMLLATACSSDKPTAVEPAYKIDAFSNTLVPIDPSKNGEKVVLLTFDDGPKEKALSEQILNTLDKHKAKAIFFMNGPQIESNNDLVKLVKNRGQMIGNHSWDHIDLSAETKESIVKQLGDVQKAVKDITGTEPAFFRPPFLVVNEEIARIASAANLTVVTCSIDSRDWEMTAENNDPEALAQRIVNQIHPGANILMHELPWTAEALDSLLTKLTEQGYGFADPFAIQK